MTDKSNKRKPDSSERQAKRNRNYERMLYRAIGNFILNSVNLWFITVDFYHADDDITDSGLLWRKWQTLLRKWRYHVPTLEYCAVCSGGASGRNTHFHIVASAPLTADTSGLDVDCREVDTSELSRNQLANYMRKNAEQDCYYLSQRWRKSGNFERWSNPLIYYMHPKTALLFTSGHNTHKTPFLSEGHPMQKLTQLHLFDDKHNVSYHAENECPDNAVNTSENAYASPDLKVCVMCRQALPNTNAYFSRNGKRLRTDCKFCARLGYTASKANRRATNGTIDKWQLREVIERQADKRTSGGIVRTVYDFWTRKPIDLFGDAWHVDHIMPLALGGTNTIDNVCITLADINTRKGDRRTLQWLRYLECQGYKHPLFVLLPDRMSPLPIASP